MPVHHQVKLRGVMSLFMCLVRAIANQLDVQVAEPISIDMSR